LGTGGKITRHREMRVDGWTRIRKGNIWEKTERDIGKK
jgi:hypothetical protein